MKSTLELFRFDFCEKSKFSAEISSTCGEALQNHDQLSKQNNLTASYVDLESGMERYWTNQENIHKIKEGESSVRLLGRDTQMTKNGMNLILVKGVDFYTGKQTPTYFKIDSIEAAIDVAFATID